MAVTTLMAELVLLYDDHGLGRPLCLCAVYAGTDVYDNAVYFDKCVLSPVYSLDLPVIYFEDRGGFR